MIEEFKVLLAEQSRQFAEQIALSLGEPPDPALTQAWAPLFSFWQALTHEQHALLSACCRAGDGAGTVAVCLDWERRGSAIYALDSNVTALEQGLALAAFEGIDLTPLDD